MSIAIESTRYNNLLQRLSVILGNSTTASPTNGYGQTLTVSTTPLIGSRNQSNLTNVNKIDADQYKNLYIDLVRCRVHQIGASAFTINPFVVGDFTVNQASTDKVEETYIQGLESLMTQIETSKFDIHIPTQANIQALTSSTRLNSTSGSWNGTRVHIFTVNFASAVSRRHFFNSGGQVRISANLAYTGTQDKTVKWRSILSNMGVISFAANRTFSNAGVGQNSVIGNYQLTSTYQLVYRNIGLSPYTGNAYEIYALQPSTTQIQFRVFFADTDPEAAPKIDENVLGDLTSTAQLARPDGAVTINGTSYSTVVFSDTITATTTTPLT